MISRAFYFASISLALSCLFIQQVHSASDTGSRITQITFGTSRDWFPSVSADGKWIVFESNRDNKDEDDRFDLWRLELSSGIFTRITRDRSVHMHDQSPSGNQIVFDSNLAGLVIVDSTHPTEIQELVPGGRPVWTSQGDRIFFNAQVGPERQNHELRVIDLKTGEIRTIFSSTSGYITPSVSPDGRFIVFSMGPWGQRDLWAISTDGSGLEQITDDPGNECLPVISPDGMKIAYYADGGGNRDIWVKPFSGGPAIRVTDHPAADISPDWYPDGQRIIFASNRTGNYKLYSVQLGRNEMGAE